jgi:hypothetical protein
MATSRALKDELIPAQPGTTPVYGASSQGDKTPVKVLPSRDTSKAGA